mmetsp:Transcript_6598/g.24495  ORF Transcript_6598/g.24495 Transcript_6598/m.24495 type:complete len:233 (+) Transcript_6598:1723-2421(+)
MIVLLLQYMRARYCHGGSTAFYPRMLQQRHVCQPYRVCRLGLRPILRVYLAERSVHRWIAWIGATNPVDPKGLETLRSQAMPVDAQAYHHVSHSPRWALAADAPLAELRAGCCSVDLAAMGNIVAVEGEKGLTLPTPLGCCAALSASSHGRLVWVTTWLVIVMLLDPDMEECPAVAAAVVVMLFPPKPTSSTVTRGRPAAAAVPLAMVLEVPTEDVGGARKDRQPRDSKSAS